MIVLISPYVEVIFMVTEQSLVRYKNSLNKSAYDLDAFEIRIILAAVAQLPAGKLASDLLLPVEAADLELIGVDPKNAYGALKKACETLFNRYITWDTVDEDGARVVVKTRWLQEAAYVDQKGRLLVRFSTRVAEHLDRLLPHITQFSYLELHSLSSAYAIRLYQLLAQFQRSGEKRFYIKVDDLRERLSLGTKYKLYGQLKEKVLDVAVQQINSAPYTAFRVRMSDTERGCKDGRKVVCLHFYFLPKEPTKVADKKRSKAEDVTDLESQSTFTRERATLSPKQIGMYADLLSGKNDKLGLTQAFYADCRAKGLLDWRGWETDQCRDDLCKRLADPGFVQKIEKWLRQCGFGG